MRGSGGMWSPVRTALLRVLADAHEPLTLGQMADRAGATEQNTYSMIRRPVTAGWVTATPTGHPRPGHHRPMHWYSITDTGREYLATLPEEDTD